MPRACLCCFFLLLFLLFIPSFSTALAGEQAPRPRAVLLSRNMTGVVYLNVDNSGDTKVTIGGRSVGISELIKLKFSNEDKSRRSGKNSVEVHYANGDVLLGTYGGGGDESIIFSTRSLGAREEAFEDLRAVFFPERIPRNIRGFRETCLKKVHKLDDIVFLKAEPDKPVAGGIMAFTTGKVKIDTGAEKYGVITPDLIRIAAVVFARDPEEEEKGGEKKEESGKKRYPKITAYLGDGSRLTGHIASLDIGKLKMTWRGDTLTIPLMDVGTVYFHNPSYVFLSDLEPVEVNESLYFQKEQEWPWRRDRSVKDGQALRIRGQVFQKGLGVHSKSMLTYQLDHQYSVFMATIGLDDEVEKEANEGREGNVDFRVTGDGKVLFEAKSVTVADKPKNININVAGVKRLTLIVDFGKNFHVQDRADWAEPILIKKK
ncbi:MAG: hypothetical protein E3J72_10450 [Planctomycetota bacterium]|nr:MAG: hypothetical protein E3J72_10450 [Planctomycetota bacterium]